MGQFEHVIVGGAEQMLAEDFAGADRVEPVGIVRGQEFTPLAAVERRAIGRDGDDCILLAEVQTLSGLDRGDKVGDAGKADQLQPGEQLRVYMTAARSDRISRSCC